MLAVFDRKIFSSQTYSIVYNIDQINGNYIATGLSHSMNSNIFI